MRDIVEIVAITLAGCWAIYVFIYENRIKPVNAAPEITFAGQLIRQGHRGDFEIVDVRAQIKNIGTVPVQFLGYSETLRGSAFKPHPPQVSSRVAQGMVETPFYSFGRPVLIYQRAFVTLAGNATGRQQILLDPGQEADENTIVYVPRAYSHVVLNMSGAFWRVTSNVLPTTLTRTQDGLPRFEVRAAGIDVPTFNTPIAEADVSGN
jgi:hypothetical protein